MDEGATNDPATVAGSSLCPNCGLRPRRAANGTRGYCRECHRAWERAHLDQKKSSRKQCPLCGAWLPHKGHGCPEKARRYYIQRARQKLNERWPSYGDVVTDEKFLARAGQNWPRIAGYPLPSEVFQGLDASLNHRLIRDQRDKDVTLCQAVSAIPADEQREFLELFLVDPVDAQHWATLPRWQRPIRKGNADDVAVWKFFTMQRLNMEQAATGTPWALASQGAQLPQMFGAVARLSLTGVQKLVAVMNGFGLVLQQGRDPGNVMKKPWDR